LLSSLSFADTQKEITDTATEAENCIDLLLPKPDSLFNESDFSSDNAHSPSLSQSIVSSGESQRKTDHQSNTVDSSIGHSVFTENSSEADLKKRISTDSNSDASNLLDVLGKHTTEVSGKRSVSSDDKKVSAESVNASIKIGDSSGDANTNNSKNSTAAKSKSNDNSDDDDEFEDMDDDELEERSMVQAHGLGSRKYNLQIEIDPDKVKLKETDDNKDLYRSLKDAGALVTVRHLPQVVKWLEVRRCHYC
jgi:hypothetical protein